LIGLTVFFFVSRKRILDSKRRLVERSAEAEQRAKELEQFAYVTSHDLKAPLRAIRNLADWLKEDLQEKLDDQAREHFDLLGDRVNRMQALIEGLLEYCRVGREKGETELVDSRMLVTELIDSLSPPPEFVIDVASNMPTMRTYRVELGQVFANLISNAIKHYGSNKGHIWIRARDTGRFFEFTVADDGPGIAAQYHEKIFLMFQALSVKDSGRDTGIGLALVKKIVQERGGSITLDSQEGEGARFRFTWPKQG
jgi:signal transduction histidine kinase